jgi:hypothetical protein
MTLMLASVESKAEAETVCADGADIIDLKDPQKACLARAAEIVRSGVKGQKKAEYSAALKMGPKGH